MELTVKELSSKALPEVDKLLGEARQELQKLRVRAVAQDLKNVRAIRTTRRVIARLLGRRHELTLTTPT